MQPGFNGSGFQFLDSFLNNTSPGNAVFQVSTAANNNPDKLLKTGITFHYTNTLPKDNFLIALKPAALGSGQIFVLCGKDSTEKF